ncbi:HAMP domain-containing sensor histidine kinase [Silanimonas algicola]
MIRTRLAIAFALVALLALVQFVFAGWAASSAAHHAERSVVATRMLAEYLALAGDKQRLKVWFAQKMLAGEADFAVRDRLVAAMSGRVDALRALAARLPADARRLDVAELETVGLNIATLERAIRDAERPGVDLPPAERWRTVMLAFDELAGRDMRELLRQAVDRHEAASRGEAERLAEVLARIRAVNALLAVSVLLMAALAVAYFVRRLDGPFAKLARTAEALAAGDFGARAALEGRDEFARIGSLMDSMAERLSDAHERSAALQHQLDGVVTDRTRALTQAYESLLGIESRRRQFLAELSHELRTPVTVIRGEADLALRNPGDADEQRAALRRIVEAASELGGRVQDLLDAARGESLAYAMAPGRHALRDVVCPAVAQMQAVAAHRHVTLAFDADGVPEDAGVEVDRERMQQALVVVLDNAIRYSPAGTRVQVTVTPEGDHWVVQVDDEGPGVDDDELEHVFDAHYRGRAGRTLDPRGLGLGLAIARRIIEAQRGSIDLRRRVPRGLRAGIALPVAEDA